MNFSRALVDGTRAALGVPAAAYALAAIGLNLQYGYAGLINVGQVGFMLVGAYGAVVAVELGAPLLLAFAFGVLAAVALGLVVGLTTLRLRAEYLAIATLASAEMLRMLVRTEALEPLTGGVFGVVGFGSEFFRWNPIPQGRYGVGPVAFSQRSLWVMAVAWSLVAACALLLKALLHSPWGRSLRALHDDEDAARSVGKPVFLLKLQSLVLGGAVGALAGLVLAVDAQFVDPDFWVLAVTTYAFTALALGGPRTTWGPVLGSMLFWFAMAAGDTLLRQALERSVFGSTLAPNDAGPIRYAAIGLCLIVLVLRRPQGLLGRRAELGAE